MHFLLNIHGDQAIGIELMLKFFESCDLNIVFHPLRIL